MKLSLLPPNSAFHCFLRLPSQELLSGLLRQLSSWARIGRSCISLSVNWSSARRIGLPKVSLAFSSWELFQFSLWCGENTRRTSCELVKTFFQSSPLKILDYSRRCFLTDFWRVNMFYDNQY